MTGDKVSKMEFEFEFPGEYTDEEIIERTVELVMESLQDNHTVPEISPKETDPFILAVMELTEKAKRDMIACAYNALRSSGVSQAQERLVALGVLPVLPPGDGTSMKRMAKIFMTAYGYGMGDAWARGLTLDEQTEARYMTHFM